MHLHKQEALIQFYVHKQEFCATCIGQTFLLVSNIQMMLLETLIVELALIWPINVVGNMYTLEQVPQHGKIVNGSALAINCSKPKHLHRIIKMIFLM